MRNAARDEKAIQAELAGNLFFGATGLTRRQFVTGGAAAAGALALAACGGTSDADTATDAGSGEAADVKKVLNFAQTNAKKGFDEAKVNDQLSYSIGDLIGEAPCMFDEDLVEKPCFLTKMPEVSEDGLTYSLELKDKIPCHDGSNLTAKDVKWSLEREMWPETAFVSLYMINFIEGAQDVIDGNTRDCSGIQVQDDTHLTIKLTFKYPTFMSILGSNFTVCYPQSAFEAAGDSWGQGTNIVGSGPYKVVSNDDSTEIVFEKFADYHGDPVNIDELHIRYIDDVNTKMLSYVNGDIDLCDVDPSLLQQYQNDATVSQELHSYEPIGTYFMMFNLNVPALQDVRVREAINLAIDRQTIVDTILSGAGTPAGEYLNPKLPGHDTSLDVIPYDPDQAKALLAEAGVSGLTLGCGVRASEEAVAVAVQDYLKAVGITLEVDKLDPGIWSDSWRQGELDTTIFSWNLMFPDTGLAMYTLWHSSASSTKGSFYNDPDFDAMIEEGRTESDTEKAAQIFKEADYKISREDWVCAPLYYPKRYFAEKPYVTGMRIGGLIYHFREVDIDMSQKPSA